MYCDHAMDTPVEHLVRDVLGVALCPRCATYCKLCGRTFHIDDISPVGLCADCSQTGEGIEMEQNTERRERIAANKLAELAAAESEMDQLRRKREQLEAEADTCAAKITAIRDELCALVEKCGGVLDVEGLPRPLVVRRGRSFVYDDETLSKWLLDNAPSYLTRSEILRVDRRALRTAVRIKNGLAYLPGKRTPVRGVGVKESVCIAIPGGADCGQNIA